MYDTLSNVQWEIAAFQRRLEAAQTRQDQTTIDRCNQRLNELTAALNVLLNPPSA